MDEFEKGVRFVCENFETYTLDKGEPVTQFGIYQMKMVPKTGLTEGSAKHLEQRVVAILKLART